MKDPTARSVMHGAITTQCPRPMPVTPLTPLRGACPAGVAHAPQRCGPARCPHAPLRRLADSNLRRAHATGSEQILRSEEHTSELQSRGHLVCRLLPEKKKDDMAGSILQLVGYVS